MTEKKKQEKSEPSVAKDPVVTQIEQKEEQQQEFEAQNYNPFKENNPPGADDGGEDDG